MTKDALNYAIITGMFIALPLGMAKGFSSDTAEEYLQKKGIQLKTLTRNYGACLNTNLLYSRDMAAGYTFTGTHEGKEVKGSLCVNHVMPNYLEMDGPT